MPQIIAIVTDAQSHEVLPDLKVEAVFRRGQKVVLKSGATSDAKGLAKLEFSKEVFRQAVGDAAGPVNQPPTHVSGNGLVSVDFQVSRDGQVLASEGRIEKLSPNGDKVTIRVKVPEVQRAPQGQDGYVVHGVVRRTGGEPVEGAKVVAVDRDLRREQQLGSATTDPDGGYEIRYTRQKFRRAEKARADLVVRVVGPNGDALAASQTIFNAEANETVDLTIDATTRVGPSEYERYVKRLAPVLDGVSLAKLTDEDLTFLHGETGIKGLRLNYLHLDATWAQPHQFPLAVFYGLMRVGLPSKLRRILELDSARRANALKSALAKHIVPAGLEQKFDDIVEQLDQMAVDSAFEVGQDDTAEPPVGALVATASDVDADVQKTFVRFSLDNADDPNFWQRFVEQSGVEEAAVQSLQFTLQSAPLVSHHLPTLRLVQKRRKEGGWTRPADITRMAPADWQTVAKQAFADKPVDGFDDPAAFADAVVDRVQTVFPGEYAAHRVLDDPEVDDADLNTFLTNNAVGKDGGFDLIETPVTSYLANGANVDGIQDIDGLEVRLKSWQRTLRVAPKQNRVEGAKRLIDAGLTSATTIAWKGQRAFVAQMTPTMGEAWSTEAFQTAKIRAEYADLTRLRLRERLDFDLPVVIPRLQPSKNKLADWSDLFGATSRCECEHCQSLYSPSAYYVDILHFLHEAPGPDDSSGHETHPLSVLFGRRPDLKHVLLNCPNTTEPLPYIDLVNEVLEEAVAYFGETREWPSAPGPHASDADRVAYDAAIAGYQTAETNLDALRARPEHRPSHGASEAYLRERYRAYEKIGDDTQTVYPWILPFDVGHEEARLFAEHLGVRLDAIRHLFGRTDSDVARALLGLEKPWKLIVKDASGPELAKLWGLTGEEHPGAYFTGHVGSFLEQAELDYEQLIELLDTEYVSSAVTVERGASPCDVSQHHFVGLDDTQLGRIYRFLRLARALDWSIDELDEVLSGLGYTEIQADADPDTVVEISRAVRLAERFHIAPAEAAALRLDTLADRLGMTAGQLQTFVELCGVDPFAGSVPGTPKTRLQRILELLDHWDILREANLGSQELAYILRHDDQVPAVFEPTEKTLSRVATSAFGVLHDAGASELTYGLDVGAAVAAFEAASSEALSSQEVDRFRKAYLGKLVEVRAALAENLATPLGLDGQIVDALISPTVDDTGAVTSPAIISAVDDSSAPAVEAFLGLVGRRDSDGFTTYETFDEVPAGALSAVEGMFVRLDKVARLLGAMRVDLATLRAIVNVGSAADFVDFNALPVEASTDSAGRYQRWETLAQAVQIAGELPRADKTLFDFLSYANESDATWAGARKLVADNTGWKYDRRSGDETIDIEALCRKLGHDHIEDFQRPATYARLHKAVRWLRRWSITVDELETWSDPETHGTALAKSLEHCAQTKYNSHKRWYEVLTPLMDELREKRRDALLAYLVHNDADFEDAADVYEHYLIDVEMSACQLTSRIKQANASVQLFVQRCLMSQEPDVDPSLDQGHWKRWEWMRNYRVWEANRKVFLYPENWIEPELRDNKSPFFEEFETELLQGEATDERVERAFRRYLEKLDDVARLEICGLYRQRETNQDGTVTKDILHVFARTRNEPHAYYYCSRDLSIGTWTNWEEIEVRIEGDHLIPAVHNGRLMLFWATFVDDDSFYDLKISWSEKRSDGWTAPKGGINPLVRIELRDIDATDNVLGIPKSSFLFRTNTHNGELVFEMFMSHLAKIPRPRAQPADNTGGSTVRHVGRETDSNGRVVVHATRPGESSVEAEPISIDGCVPYSMAQFVFDDCAQCIRFDGASTQSRFLALPDTTRPEAMQLVLQGESLKIYEQVSGRQLSNSGAFPDIYDVSTSALEGRQNEPSSIALSPDMSVPEYRRLASVIAVFEDFDPHLVDQRQPRVLLDGSHSEVRVVPTHQNRQFSAHDPFCVAVGGRAYLVTRRGAWGIQDAQFNVSGSGLLFWGGLPTYKFEYLHHPLNCDILRQVHRHSIAGLLAAPAGEAFDRQVTPKRPSQLHGELGALATVAPSVEHVDFRPEGAYSTYNWEIFFHIPMLVAGRLSDQGRFEEARRWYHYVFDPTDVSNEEWPAKYWKLRPFFKLAQEGTETIEELLRRIAAGEETAQINAWRDDPFNPHHIARLRKVAYMKTVVMKYVANLIAWGDDLFGRDTMESINEATQLYVLAAQILGDAPTEVPTPERDGLTFAEIQPDDGHDFIDGFSNVWVDVEDWLPVDLSAPSPGRTRAEVRPLLPYFCISANQKLSDYRKTVADRLFKIRHCMNIAGQTRQLPLFEPPIDPALLVRARAAGLDIGRALSTALPVRLPHYRFSTLHQRAMQFCGEVRTLGNSLLSALEKKDAQALQMLRARHQSAMLERVRAVKKQRVTEADDALQSLKASKRMAKARLDYYSSREFMNDAETQQVVLQGSANVAETVAKGLSAAAAIAHAFPDVSAGTCSGVTTGGTSVGNALRAGADISRAVAGTFSFAASMTGTFGRYTRRMDDWKHQAKQAQIQLDKLERDIAAAEIRHAIAENDLANHELQIRQAGEVEDFLRSKFTNEQLYGWMVSQLSALHHQAYRMAVEMAKKAERAAQNELGLEAADFAYVGFSNWDSRRKGLLAGDRLHQDLSRMESAYLEQNRREHELTKHISLAMLDPEQLVRLREDGECQIRIPEVVFDLDFAGHYLRRIKSVSLTIPCVTGPYTTVNATLRLLHHKIRRKLAFEDSTSAASYDDGLDLEPTYEGTSSIATSTAQGDNGMFEFSFKDGRFLPFEGAGAISTWTLHLPNDFRSFDYDTISDVVLHMKYTARPGGDAFKSQVDESLSQAVDAWVSTLADSQTPLTRLFSLRREFSAQLYRFLHPASPGDTTCRTTLEIEKRHFPYLFRDQDLSLCTSDSPDTTVSVRVLLEPSSKDDYGLGGASVDLTLQRTEDDVVPQTLAQDETLGHLPVADFHHWNGEQPTGRWTLSMDAAALPDTMTVGEGDARRIDPDAVDDVLLELRYVVSSAN